VLCAVCFVLSLPGGCGEEPRDDGSGSVAKADHDLLTRDGRAVIERNIAAMGGHEALTRIQNRTLRGTIEVEPLGIEGTFTIVQARPNKVYMKLDTQGLGVIERGCDGTVFWERREQEPLRRFQGDELDLHLLTAFFDDTYYETMYQSIESMGLESVEASPCYKVLLVPFRGPSIINYYSQETGLLAKTLLRIKHGGFTTDMESYLLDYRIIRDIQVAHTVLEKSLGTETWRRLTHIELNGEIEEGLFNLPVEPNASSPGS
jgi:hypothetical protein